MALFKNKKRRIAINGFGRIGRAAFKVALEKKNLEIAAVNDLTDPATLAHLLRYDTVYGRFARDVVASDKKPIASPDCHGCMEIDGKTYPILSQKDPSKLPWADLGVDVVIESTGFFTKTEDAKKHIAAGARRVIVSAPAKDDGMQTYVIGVNTARGVKDEIVSNASCTTNCIAPVMAILEANFGIAKAAMTTIHAYTADQNLVDGPHKDLRRARAAGANIVPTTTGAAAAASKTIPTLSGKFDGIAIRVPVICGSLSDFSVLLKRNATAEEVNEAFRQAAAEPRWKNIVAVTEEPLVSSDIIGNTHSTVIDLSFTKVVDGDFLKVLAWYDNELAYAHRLVELAESLIIT